MAPTRSTKAAKRIAATLAIAVTGGVVPSTGAWGWATGFSVAQGGSATNSLGAKSASASCPSGAGAVGVAAFVSPVLANLGLTQLRGGASVSVRAAETDSESSGWSVSTRAFCLYQQSFAPTAGNAASFVKGVQVVEHWSASNSNDTKTVSVSCPAGKSVISGGGTLGTSTLDLALTSLQRMGGSAWRVSAREVDSTGSQWRVRAAAVCANITTETQTADYVNANGGQRPSVDSGSGSPPVALRSASCSAGRIVVGGFAEILNSAGTGAGPNGVVLIGSAPSAGGTSWSALAHETDPTDQAWRLVVRAICVPLTGPPPQ